MSSNIAPFTSESILAYARNQSATRHIRAVPAPAVKSTSNLVYVRAHYRRRKGCK